jgi:hypothetical protein
MTPKTILFVFIALFSLCWALFIGLSAVAGDFALFRLGALFDSDTANLIFLMIVFLTTAGLATTAADLFYGYVRRMKPFRPRLGRLLVERGYITREELSLALKKQQRRIGEILIDGGCLTPRQLEEALTHQKKARGKKLGEILRALGYATARDVGWALDQINLKLGNILVEMGLINETDLRRNLGRQWYGRHQRF